MTFIGMAVHGAGKVAGDFTKKAAAVQPAVNKVTRAYTHLLVTRIRAKASGRPGPNAPTGDYRRSWTAEFSSGPDGSLRGEAGTAKPQGPRLEWGFTGVDAIGRHYDQPPFPHVEPAANEITEEYAAAVGKIAGAGSISK